MGRTSWSCGGRSENNNTIDEKGLGNSASNSLDSVHPQHCGRISVRLTPVMEGNTQLLGKVKVVSFLSHSVFFFCSQQDVDADTFLESN